MSTDTFSDIETRLRSELPRLADTLVASGADSEVGPDDLHRLEPEPGDRPGRRRGLIPAIAVAAVVLVLLGLVLAVRRSDDHDAKPVDVGPAPVEAGWAPMATSPLSPREAAVAVWTGTEVIIWGGRVGNMALLDGAAYNPSTDTWRTIASNSWGHPAAHAVWTGTEMVVLAKNGGAAYDPATDTWHDLPLLGEGSGAFLAPVWTGQELLGIGLDVAPNDASVSLTTSVLGADDATWEQRSSTDVGGNAFDTSSDQQVVWTGSEAVVWSGFGPGWAYDPKADGWREIPATTEGSAGAATFQPVAVDGTLYQVLTNIEEPVVPSSQITLLRATADGWTDVAALQDRTGGKRPTVTTAGGRILVVSVDFPPLAYDVAADAWSDPDGTQLRAAGSNQATAWTGDELVLWGGTDPAGGAMATGWRWHPGG